MMLSELHPGWHTSEAWLRLLLIAAPRIRYNASRTVLYKIDPRSQGTIGSRQRVLVIQGCTACLAIVRIGVPYEMEKQTLFGDKAGAN